MEKLRLDDLLVRRGFAPSRARARDSIVRGCVRVGGRLVEKAGAMVPVDARVRVDDPALKWVSRAALKLVAGLDAFGFDVAGRTCVDIGASTGGFTQVLLARGAARIHAVDVGHDQLAALLAEDPRVVVHEGLNARDLTKAELPEPLEVTVADVSFISLKLALPAALDLAAPEAVLVALVKPQFEVGRDGLGKGGIVRDRAAVEAVAKDVASWLQRRGWEVVGLADSPIAGADGNREVLLGARKIC